MPPLALRPTVVTLGCKLNQNESEGIAGAFREAGACPVGVKDANLVVVNTCAVTSKAEQKARRAIRSLLKANPMALFVLTGCYATLDGAALGRLDTGGRVFVLEGARKAALLTLPQRLARGEALKDALSDIARTQTLSTDSAFAFNTTRFLFHSRPSLKVEDGCDNACTFCAVRLARGKSASLAADEALRRLQMLEAAGAAEVVLTGVNIAEYRDAKVGTLAGLLRFLIEGTERVSLRLSSLDGDVFDDELFAVLGLPRVRPHFHLSIQSGSDVILKAMGRHYTAERLRSIIGRLREVKVDPFIACDMITGFPGETAADAAASEELCLWGDFAWVHGFRYSPRPGTLAAMLTGKVSEREADERLARLVALGRAGRQRYVTRHVGQRVLAVREATPTPAGTFPATTENYLKVLVRPPAGEEPPRIGAEFALRLTSPNAPLERFDAEGTPV
jgi:threonylcarbamoyladenosine tRNA methylthiotransferase MtaB